VHMEGACSTSTEYSHINRFIKPLRPRTIVCGDLLWEWLDKDSFMPDDSGDPIDEHCRSHILEDARSLGD
jgi:hypothetical protein